MPLPLIRIFNGFLASIESGLTSVHAVVPVHRVPAKFSTPHYPSMSFHILIQALPALGMLSLPSMAIEILFNLQDPGQPLPLPLLRSLSRFLNENNHVFL